MDDLIYALSNRELMDIKLALLSNGLRFSNQFLDRYEAKFIEKRWAYGNSDETKVEARIPPEIYIGDLISAVHYVPASPWLLDFDIVENRYVLSYNREIIVPVTFPLRPRFYDEVLQDGTPCKAIGTLYGGGSLGIFALGTCYYFRVDKQCGFCSLEPTRTTHGDHSMLIRPKVAAELVEIVLKADPSRIKQIMLNGGNRKNNDEGFLHHVESLRSICAVVEQSKIDNKPEVHVITMPPDNLALLREINGLPIKISMNLEVFSPMHFNIVAPGKAELYGRAKLIHALEDAVEILGPGNVYTIFVGGLEPLETLQAGLQFVAERGIVPVINVFHRDPNARFADHPRVSVEEMHAMGRMLQEIYRQYSFEPFYRDCGRNSIDSEAYYQYF